MRRHIHSTIVVVSAVALSWAAGCAGTDTARSLATRTAAQTLAYEEDIRLVSDSLQESLAQQIELQKDVLDSQMRVAERDRVSALALTFTEETFAKGYRRDRLDAYLLSTTTPNNQAAARISAQTTAALARQRNEIRSRTRTAIAKLRATRTSLEKLATEQSPREFLATLADLAAGIELGQSAGSTAAAAPTDPAVEP